MDFYYETHSLDLGGPSQKVMANKEAITTMKRLLESGVPATRGEQEILSKYVGYGDSRLTRGLYDLESILTPDEMKSARASMLNAHYTALPVVSALWYALGNLGLLETRLKVLDPSGGIGIFKSMAPEDARERMEWTEVELDILTANILRLLHPGSRVLQGGFESLDLPPNYFDLALSNVPFGNYPVHTKHDLPNFLKRSIHDFFFANTYRLLKPGGVLAYITSRFTMDKKDNRVREWLSQRFTLLSAIRLPSTAFKENAGTEVVTDILIMRKRPEIGEANPEWLDVGVFDTGMRRTYVNKYFLENSHFIMGEPDLSGSMYQRDGYSVTLPEGTNLAGMLEGQYSYLAELPKLVIKEEEVVVVEEKVSTIADEEDDLSKKLMHMYRIAKQLIKADAEGEKKAANLRGLLNTLYDNFLEEYGTVRSSLKAFKSAEAFFLASLEKDDFSKADIFHTSTVRASTPQDDPGPGDALILCLDTRGKVDLGWIAKRLNMTEEQAAHELKGSIFLDPETLQWVTKEAYLSGNVRQKTRAAKAAAEYNEAFKDNVIALESVHPVDIPYENIRVPFGAGWIPGKDMAKFFEHLLGPCEFEAKFVPVMSLWTVNAKRFDRAMRSDMYSKWGTSRKSAWDLIEDGLQSKIPQVYDGTLESRVINTAETAAAQAKLEEIKAEFEKWLWSDKERADRLAELYNELFNSEVNPRYDGSFLSTPGLSNALELRSNQYDGAWRIIQSPTTLLGHEVGMGKTLTAIVAAMEGKRLGVVSKVMFVVPNHTVYGDHGWASTMQRAYPGANILIPTPEDLKLKNRIKFMSMIATNSWDMILVPFTTFKSLPTSPELEADFLQEELDELREALQFAREENDRITEKQIEKAIKRAQVRIEKLRDHEKDDATGITWEELGIDMMIVDEFHAYKNLQFYTRMSRVAGISNSASQRSLDMLLKSRYLLEKGGKFVGMTGTPITNTIAEMYTMQRYFDFEGLRKLGIHGFDAWARQFALAEPGLEMAPDGSGFRMNTRFRKFVNLPELMKLFLRFADMRRIGNGGEIERPDLFNGKPVKVVVSGGDALRDYVGTLAVRAEKVRSGAVEPKKDNMLKITTDGRKAALDISLCVPGPEGAPMPKVDKLTSVVKNIREITDPGDGVQLIFCDLGTPKAKRDVIKDTGEDDDEIEAETEEEHTLMVNVYGEIRKRMVQAGIPDNEIGYIHDGTTPEKKKNLMNAVNEGKIRVLIGSNEKMGTGVNVQMRCVATHHITPPWRPGDLEQQLGRMWRQGNLYNTVYQFIYITEGSFDGYNWQLLENKAGFISQVMAGSVSDREADDIGETVLTFTEIKGLASGNPDVMKKVVLDTEITRLGFIRSSWAGSQNDLRRQIRFKNEILDRDIKAMKVLEHAVALRNQNVQEKFSIEVKDAFGNGVSFRTVTNEKEAGQTLLLMAHRAAQVVVKTSVERVEIAKYRGFSVCATATSLDRDAGTAMYFFFEDTMFPLGGKDGEGLILSMDAILRGLDKKLEKARESIMYTEKDIKEAAEALEKPWEQQEKLDKLILEVEEVNNRLNLDKKEQEDLTVKAPVTLSEQARSLTDLEDAYKSIEEMMRDTNLLIKLKGGVVPDKTQVKTRVDPVQVRVVPKPKTEDWRPSIVPKQVENPTQLSFGF